MWPVVALAIAVAADAAAAASAAIITAAAPNEWEKGERATDACRGRRAREAPHARVGQREEAGTYNSAVAPIPADLRARQGEAQPRPASLSKCDKSSRTHTQTPPPPSSPPIPYPQTRIVCVQPNFL